MASQSRPTRQPTMPTRVNRHRATPNSGRFAPGRQASAGVADLDRLNIPQVIVTKAH